MKFGFSPRLFMLSALACAASGATLAAPLTIFGVDLNSNYTVSPTGQPAQQQANFANLLSANTIQTETFQSLAADDASTASSTSGPLSLELLGGAATLTMPTQAVTTPVQVGGKVSAKQIVGPGRSGRFSTSPDCTADGLGNGCNWWESSADFTLNFANAISAFGFFGTDFGDYLGGLSLDLYSGGNLMSTLTVPPATAQVVTGGPSPTASGGNLIFFGFTDSLQSYDQIVFHVNQVAGNTDVLGFDDMMIGHLENSTHPIPEPASLALVGLSLAALAATRRKKQR